MWHPTILSSATLILMRLYMWGVAANPSHNSNNFCNCVPLHECRKQSYGGSIVPNICHDYRKICCESSDIIRTTKCGKRNGNNFVNNGQKINDVQVREFPWMVSILEYKDKIGPNNPNGYNEQQCGGSLINSKAALTVASCVNGKNSTSLRVSAGKSKFIGELQVREVSKIVINPYYDSRNSFSDYGILILSIPFNFNDYVNVICLPERNDNFNTDQCIATGWGNTVGNLRSFELWVYRSNVCESALRQTAELGSNFHLDSSFICAGGELGIDMCERGDIGSPLVCKGRNNPNVYVQAGILSFGVGCNRSDVPRVFADVANARTWIDSTMVDNNLDTNEYL